MLGLVLQFMKVGKRMKKKVIFVIHSLSIGGSQKSLINVLSQFAYSNYDVTLYVRDMPYDLAKTVPPQVRLVLNKYDKDYDKYAIKLNGKILGWLRKRIPLFKRLCKRIEKWSLNRAVEKKSSYEAKNHGELLEKYDIAISYLHEYVCRFTYDYIDAKYKICFYHVSTDSKPDIHKIYLPKYDKVITITDETAAFLINRYPELENKIAVIPNFINVSEILNKSKQSVLLTTDTIQKKDHRILLCTCGTLSQHKGSFLAIETAKILCQKQQDFLWIFIGDGPAKENIAHMIMEYGLENRVVLIGKQENPYPYFSMADIYVQPSLEESQCLAIMEAQILGIPVVTTDTVGGHNVVNNGKTGVIVPITAVDLANGIDFLLSNVPLLKTIRQNIRKLDYSMYNNNCSEKWKTLMQEAQKILS